MKPIVSVSIPPSPSPCHNSNQQRSIRSIRSKTVLNPKRVITTSLCLWIFLVLSAPKLGLKNSLLFKVNSSGGLDAPNSIFSSPGSIGSAQMLTCLSGYNSNKVTDPDMVDPDVDMGLDVEGEYPDVFMPTVINDQELEKLVQDAEEDLVMDSEWMGGDDDDDDDEIVVDGEEGEEEEREYSGVPEPFDYDSFSLLEEEEESAQDDVIGLMNCNKYLGGQQQGNGGQERLEHSFEYVPYWTHAMIILISLPIGGMIAGRNLMHSQAQEMISELESKLNKNGTVYSYIRNTVPFKMIIMGNLGFFFSFGWIILYGHNEHFDLYFASIGLGLMVLTQKWIPEDLETMLETNSVRRSSYEVEADIVVDLEKDTKEFQV
ncbi:hypothetical protein BGZ76_000742 [Entomortierella beljakovae]|nr:hypothetical protein BGZ76_000742 [Entomortierella beljakovae]